MQTYRQEYGGITILFQAVQCDVLTEGDPAFYFGAHILDNLDLACEDVTRQAVFGDAVAHHTAGLGKFFEDGDLIAFLEKTESGSDACRAGADDRYLLAALFGFDFGKIILASFSFIVAQKTMQLPDGKRGVNICASTFSFTRMMTYASTDPGERVFLFEKF
jgi:hypothetical protein